MLVLLRRHILFSGGEHFMLKLPRELLLGCCCCNRLHCLRDGLLSRQYGLNQMLSGSDSSTNCATNVEANDPALVSTYKQTYNKALPEANT